MDFNPCGKCKNAERCQALKILKDKGPKIGPWELDKYLHLNTLLVLVRADGKEIVVECPEYVPDKKDDNFSELIRHDEKRRPQVRCKCGGSGGCSGKCVKG